MGQYNAKSVSALNFVLSSGQNKTGELIYEKWYSFSAEILMGGGRKFKLTPVGYWNSKIELKEGSDTLLDFKMGWHGIVIRTFWEGKEENYLLKPKGLLSNKFLLLDTENRELAVAETNFKWASLNFEFTIETDTAFDDFENKDLLLLTMIHCINYYMTVHGCFF